MIALTVLAIVLGIAWVLGFLVFNVAAASIHLLLILALVCGVMALVARRRDRRLV